MAEPALTNVFAFTARRDEIARFFEDVLGLRRQTPRDDSVWFESADGATPVVARSGDRATTVAVESPAHFAGFVLPSRISTRRAKVGRSSIG